MSQELRVKRLDGYYVVCEGDKVISTKFSQPFYADIEIDNILKKRAVKTRPCMCCQEDFTSEGPHNRLCSKCRVIS